MAIIIDSGKAKLTPLPNDFYHSYRDNKIQDVEMEIAIYAGEHPELSIISSDLKAKREYGEWLLNKYFVLIKTFYYLLPNGAPPSRPTDKWAGPITSQEAL